jgi:pyruvate/2-oxoglutarate dehydrogenase complex dihydrolipoamide acyltransferase (E2) component
VSSSPTSAAIVEVTMPQMGVSVAEGTIVEWRKRPGEPVEADEPIVEISTDKVETEIPAPAGGRLKDVLVEPGQTVDVGTVLATIETAAGAGDGAPAAGRGEVDRAPAAEPTAERSAGDGRAEEHAAAPTAERSAGDGRAEERPPPVTPVVRRIADEHGIDLSQVRGTGRRGRVTKKDALAYLHERAEAAPKPPEEKPEPVLHGDSPYREEAAAVEAPAEPRPGPPPAAAPATGARELSVMRKQIAEHMVRSVRTAAHCTTIAEADMSRIAAVRGELSYLPFVARATVSALREHPALNATLEGDRLTVHDGVHLGIAVSLGEEGLIVPVIRSAHELSAEGLAARIKDLAERARGRRLSPDDVGGGTFTITSPGAFGALLATPIISQPQVAILDLEAVVKRPVVVTDSDGRDSIAIRPMTYLCMSWDHRALDGVLAAQFLATLRRRIEGWSG